MQSLVRRGIVASSRVRFASTASPSPKPKTIKVVPPLQYKGRIPRSEPIAEQPATADAAPEPETVPLPPSKPQPTKEQRYSEASRRYLVVMCGSPILIVTSYYLYRRLFLGEDQKKLVLINEATE